MTGRRAVPIRFRILGLLLLLSFVNYLLRNNLSVALPSIRAEFDFTSAELGWILGSFNLAYALFQLPGGVFGQALGPRRALAILAVSWGVLTALTGFAPSLMLASATGAMVALMIVRFLLGIANAPLFPVMAGAIANWFPVSGWAFPNASSSMALSLGQASIGPVVTALIVAFGWRASFYVLAPLGIIAGVLWWLYARDEPAQHPAVRCEELELIRAGREPEQQQAPHAWRIVLVDRNVLLLAASYFCMNVVFYIFANWLFTYLVEERGFSLLESGALYALPFIVGAVLAVVGGLTCDALCRRIGPRWGCRAVGVLGMGMVAWLLLAGANAANPYMAVALLSLCYGFTQFTEGAFWSGTTFVAGPYTAAAGGVLNTGGN
ncbi:MAG TPA: MFS transporter, partial [Steroidobacteraceae bacterium]|nr:MFS transporter [Steroidobacteraceae bacterium]